MTFIFPEHDVSDASVHLFETYDDDDDDDVYGWTCTCRWLL